MKKTLAALFITASSFSAFAQHDHVCNLNINGEIMSDSLLAEADAKLVETVEAKSGKKYNVEIAINDLNKEQIGRMVTLTVQEIIKVKSVFNTESTSPFAQITALNIDAQASFFSLSAQVGSQSIDLTCVKD